MPRLWPWKYRRRPIPSAIKRYQHHQVLEVGRGTGQVRRAKLKQEDRLIGVQNDPPRGGIDVVMQI